jgi:hypothetical protein
MLSLPFHRCVFGHGERRRCMLERSRRTSSELSIGIQRRGFRGLGAASKMHAKPLYLIHFLPAGILYKCARVC